MGYLLSSRAAWISVRLSQETGMGEERKDAAYFHYVLGHIANSFQEVRLSKICIQSIKKISKKHKKFLSFLTEQKYSEKASDNPVNHSSCPEPLPSGVKKVSTRQAWEKSKSVSLEQCKLMPAALQGNDFEYTAKIRTLAETEQFFDELTKEKDQVKLIKYKKNFS